MSNGHDWIGVIAGLYGGLAGTVALVVSWLAYRRERGHIHVEYICESKAPGTDDASFLLQVTNDGLRPIVIAYAYAVAPPRYNWIDLSIGMDVPPPMLTRERPTADIHVPAYGSKLDEVVRFGIIDGTGREYTFRPEGSLLRSLFRKSKNP